MRLKLCEKKFTTQEFYFWLTQMLSSKIILSPVDVFQGVSVSVCVILCFIPLSVAVDSR